MTTTLEQLCKQVIDAGEKATNRPWYSASLIAETKELIKDHTAYKADQHANPFANIDYLKVATDNADKLARVCLVMLKELGALRLFLKVLSDQQCLCDPVEPEMQPNLCVYHRELTKLDEVLSMVNTAMSEKSV